MGKRYGLSVTDDGMVVEAAVRLSGGSAGFIGTHRWSSHSFFRNYFLLMRTVSLGLPSHWVKMTPPASDNLVITANRQGFMACSNRTEFDYFTEVFGNSITALYPDDAFLATIPLHFAQQPPDSFISLASMDGDSISIGVVVRRELHAVFRVRASTRDNLEGFIGRIKRSFRFSDPELPEIDTCYLLTADVPPNAAPDGAIPVSCGTTDTAVLRAIGCALPSAEHAVPRFSGTGPVAGTFRHLRSTVIIGAALLLAAAGLSTALLSGYNAHYGNLIDQTKKQYHHLFSNNTELRTLIAEGDSLSRKLIEVNRRLSRPTRWAPFLELLGTVKPRGLFLERLGSEPVDSAGSRVRIALAGWCETETTATEFIKALKKSRLIEGATLSSIDRVSEQNTTCRFKILCVLKISDR